MKLNIPVCASNGKERWLALNFDDAQRILPDSAEKWARALARDWGRVNWQRKISARSLSGHVWWFSCSGHSGYILVARPQDMPPEFERFAAAGSPTWADAQGLPPIGVYRFEEDCDWAVLCAFYPEVAALAGRSAQAVSGCLWRYFCDLTDSARRWANQ